MILIKGENSNIEPILEDKWTSTTISCPCHLRGHDFIVIGHYTPQRNKYEGDNELKSFITELRKSYPNLNVVIAGDFNRTEG